MRYTLEDNVTNAILYAHKGIKGSIIPVAVEAVCVSNSPEGRRVLTEWYNSHKAEIDKNRAYRDAQGLCATCTKCDQECKPDYTEVDKDLLIVACTSYRSAINDTKERPLQRPKHK